MFEFYKIIVQLPIFFLHNNHVARTSCCPSAEHTRVLWRFWLLVGYNFVKVAKLSLGANPDDTHLARMWQKVLTIAASSEPAQNSVTIPLPRSKPSQ